MCEDWVGQRWVIWEREGGIGVGLVVGRLRLDLAHEDVLGVDELVFVEDVVFDCRAGSGTMLVTDGETMKVGKLTAISSR